MDRPIEQIAVFIDFENIARWAEEVFLDFELTPVIEHLQSRGALVIKRAYGDWSRFAHYRDEMMDNAFDLIQMYSVRAGKNRADIRMAMDALETAMTRPHIRTFVIISGDSDFGALVSKLREYGKYTLGIGPRQITHRLLVKSCDEFIYLETLLDESAMVSEQAATDREAGRILLRKTLRALGQRGETPVEAARLRQTMLSMDPTFNEASFGFRQFKDWLAANEDLVSLREQDLRLYVVLREAQEREIKPLTAKSPVPPATPAPLADSPTGLARQYRQIFSRLKMAAADFSTRRDVLRDIYRELSDHPGEYTTDSLLETLRERYEQQGFGRSKTMLRHIWQMGFRQRAFGYGDQPASVRTPVWLAPDIDSESAFVRRAESGFVYAIIHAGLEVNLEELAAILVNDADQADYIQTLLNELEARGLIVSENGHYRLPGHSAIPFCDHPALRPICREIEQVQLPENVTISPEKAFTLAKRAMIQRSQDFSASARSYLYACRIQWEAVINRMQGANLEDLRWLIASYASVRAGELSQVDKDYAQSRTYYLAFFLLVQEDDPLWSRMRGLINPMLVYYWANAGRELGVDVSSWNLSAALPAQVAMHAVTHKHAELVEGWRKRTRELAEVNPGVLKRVVEQIRHNYPDQPAYLLAADAIQRILEEAKQPVLLS
ncbi:MAG TPA: NYN domain-containing protein [Caldilineae bacterium]|nr:NYN domain-containing protein [Caldilineae bacterium]HIQ11791.1 NYN domain-containing protein [Caldilineales bacterium]